MIAVSLGAGVQSSFAAVLASEGKLNNLKVRRGIFADTHDEPAEVYRWLDWWSPACRSRSTA